MTRCLTLVLAVLLLVTGCGRSAAPPPDRPDVVSALLAEHGWKADGPIRESTMKLPADFKLRSGFPWAIVADLSRDVGLNLEPYAGQEVPYVSLPVVDIRGGRLAEHGGRVRWVANVLLAPQTGEPIGAYLIQTGENGEVLLGAPGPSLTGRSLEEITGLSWPEYLQARRAEQPSPAVLEGEKPRNAIYSYFRAVSAHDCAAVWVLVSAEAQAKSSPQAWCGQYGALDSVRVIEVEGYAKADTPQGFRFLDSHAVAATYYVILDVRIKPAVEPVGWVEGHNNRLIPVVRDADGEYRLGGPGEAAPTH